MLNDSTIGCCSIWTRSKTLFVVILLSICMFLLYFLLFPFFSIDPFEYGKAFLPQFSSAEQLQNQLCIDGNLIGTKNGAGHGNVAFELLNLIGVAERFNRIPIITDAKTNQKLAGSYPHFPNIWEYMDDSKLKKDCPKATLNITLNKCCIYREDMLQEIENNGGNHTNIQLRIVYGQSFKYFSKMPLSRIRHLLQAPYFAKRMANNDLFPENREREKRKNLCLHIRRGNFVNNSIALPSNGKFIKSALKFIISEEFNNTDPDIYAFSNDNPWTKELLSKDFPTTVCAAHNNSFIPNTEWEFSRMYCDVVLSSASASTYGWWIGYLSRGQQVYYNAEFSTKGGIEKELVVNDFFPHHWIPLKLLNENKIEKIKRVLDENN